MTRQRSAQVTAACDLKLSPDLLIRKGTPGQVVEDGTHPTVEFAPLGASGPVVRVRRVSYCDLHVVI